MEREHVRFTSKHALQLAAPHTWAASVIPVISAGCFAVATGYAISLLTMLVLLLISVLMQSAVNALNDYMDYVKGSDSIDDDVDPSDAVLVYQNINPRNALFLSCGFIAAAFLLGIYCIAISGFIPLVIALIGVSIVFLYSGGKTPISYLPIGELVSGFVMGGLITLASYTVLTDSFQLIVLVWSIPVMIGIGLIMMTNNGCDIAKDIEAGRRTLPVMLGHRRTVLVYHGSMIAWYICYIAITAIWFPSGLAVIPFALILTAPSFLALWRNPLESDTRRLAMGQVLGFNVYTGIYFLLTVLAGYIWMLLFT